MKNVKRALSKSIKTLGDKKPLCHSLNGSSPGPGPTIETYKIKAYLKMNGVSE